jgi:hypothetical protein
MAPASIWTHPAKGISVGLLAPDATPGDAQIAELIFNPASPPPALTELSGRGVGMDVVQSEAQALGGRVELATEAKGARFTIRLPLTLAVTQVVLLARRRQDLRRAGRAGGAGAAAEGSPLAKHAASGLQGQQLA